jgi:hypothetical protein
MKATIFMATFSAAGRISDRKPEPLSGPPAIAIVERWDGTRWIEQHLVWDGAQEKYVDAKEVA